jgi:flagellar protein FliS
MTPYAKANDQYLAQQVMGASPLRMVVLLLEGGQKFLGHAVQALNQRDYALKARKTNTVLAIIDELAQRLDFERGGDLARNLDRIYDWWTREVLQASADKDGGRLERVARQMGELRQAWEQLERQGAGSAEMPELQIRDMVG